MAVIPFFVASTPVRWGMVYSFRVRAFPADVALGGFLEAMSKRDAFKGFFPRMERMPRVCCDWHGRDRREAGRRKREDRDAQLRGSLGGIVDSCWC